MPELNDLGTFAQVAIGLVGFAAVVSVLSRSRLPAVARFFRIRALLIRGGTAFVGSLIPLVLHKFGLTGGSLWLLSSLVLFCLILGSFLHSFHYIRLIRNAGGPTPTTAYVMQPITGAVLVLLAYGLTFGQSHLPGVFFVGIFWSLLAGLIQFILLILSVELAEGDP